MSSVRTNGIVLRGTNFGEADRILTVLTDRFGKIKVMAKGIRKIRSHLAGSLEPFMLVDLQLHEGKTFYIATGAVIVDELKNIHEDIKKTARAFFIGELVDRFLEENQKSERIFDLFYRSLQFIECNQCETRNVDVILRAFELKIIEAAGFKPELYDCVHCKNQVVAGGNFWDPVEGGVICPSCQEKFHHGKEIADETIKLFRFIEKFDFEQVNLLKLKEETALEAEKFLSLYVQNILERELKSQRFLMML